MIDCLAAQEAWFRETHPKLAAAIDAIGMPFAEYHALIVSRRTGKAPKPYPAGHWDIRVADWHWEDQCPEANRRREVAEGGEP